MSSALPAHIHRIVIYESHLAAPAIDNALALAMETASCRVREAPFRVAYADAMRRRAANEIAGIVCLSQLYRELSLPPSGSADGRARAVCLVVAQLLSRDESAFGRTPESPSLSVA